MKIEIDKVIKVIEDYKSNSGDWGELPNVCGDLVIKIRELKREEPT